MERGSRKAVLAATLIAVSVLLVPAGTEGGTVDRFSGGALSAEARLEHPGSVAFANLSVPARSVPLSTSLRVSPVDAGGSFPTAPSLDIAGDGTTEWAFNGTGYGAFGRQELFSDGQASRSWNFTSPGNVRLDVLLPAGASVASAGMELRGEPPSAWWNLSWRGRVRLEIEEKAGKNQTDFVIEKLLDTREWNVCSAEREFRVTRVNSTTGEETEVPLQVLDEVGNGTRCFEASLLFAVSGLAANSSQTCYLYFDNPSAAGRSALYTDFGGRMVRNRLLDQPAEVSIFEALRTPLGSAFDGWGNLWVVDGPRHCVVGYAGTLGTPGSSGSDASRLSSPSDVAVRRDGKVAVVDTGNSRVQVFQPDGSVWKTLGTNGVPGTDNQHFLGPVGVATDQDGYFYVSDQPAHRVQVFDENGTYFKTIGVAMSPGTANDRFSSPMGLAVSPSKDLFVADRGNFRVQQFRYSSGSWTYNYTLGTTGQMGSDDSHFMGPVDVALDSASAAFVVDAAGSRVVKYKGTATAGKVGQPLVPGREHGLLMDPRAASISPSGKLFISDSGNGRVEIFDGSLGYLQTLGSRHAATRVFPGTSSFALNSPCGVAADGQGRVYISDTENQRVRVLSALGADLATLGTPGATGTDLSHFYYPRGLSVTSGGKVFVADGGKYDSFIFTSNHRVLVFNNLLDSNADSVIGVTGVHGSDGTHLNQPWDASANTAGALAVADKGFVTSSFPQTVYGQRVQLFSDLADAVADLTYGSPGAPGCDTTHLCYPEGVGLSDGGRVYVADTGNNRLVGFYPDGNGVADLVVNAPGTAGAGDLQFFFPSDVDVDSQLRLFVADSGNHRVQVLSEAGAFSRTLGVTGSNLSDALHFNSPEGVSIGEDDKIYVADTGNHRVVRISPATLALGKVEELQVPSRVALDLGADGVAEWNSSSELVGSVRLEGLAGAFTSILANLTGSPDAFGNPVASVAVNLTNLGVGRLALLNLSVTYDCSLALPDFTRAVSDHLLAHASEADPRGNVSVPICFSASSAGGVRLSDLVLAADFPPELVSPVGELSLDEDSAAASLLDLSKHFRDDIDASLIYSLVCATNASRAMVDVSAGGILSVDCTGPPSRNWNGRMTVRATAADSRGLTADTNDIVVVVRPVNDPPGLVGRPSVLAATVGEEWSYQARAEDVENDTLTYSLQAMPSGMAVDASTGLLRWTPTADQVGPQAAELRVSDGALWDSLNFTMNVSRVAPANRPPRIVSSPVTAVEVGGRYSYDVEAKDDDEDPLAFSLDRFPEGMTVNETSGLVAWSPQAAHKGVNPVTVRVSDGRASATQSFNVTVASNLSSVMPTIRISGPANGTRVRGKVLVTGNASAMMGVVEAVEVSLDYTDRWQAATGRTNWSFELDTAKLSNGIHRVLARVRDTPGNQVETGFFIDVQNPSGKEPAGPSKFLGLESWSWLLLMAGLVAAGGGAAYALARKGRRAAPGAAPAAPSAAAPAPARAPAPGEPVDSAFLIYHDGRLITYFSRSASIKLDETLDMIRKFVRASFSGQLGKLDSMRYESMNILMERGNLMYLVVVTPLPRFEELRRDMRRLLNEIDSRYRVLFKVWDGDFNKVKAVKKMVDGFAGEDVGEEETETETPRKPAVVAGAGGAAGPEPPAARPPPAPAPKAVTPPEDLDEDEGPDEDGDLEEEETRLPPPKVRLPGPGRDERTPEGEGARGLPAAGSGPAAPPPPEEEEDADEGEAGPEGKGGEGTGPRTDPDSPEPLGDGERLRLLEDRFLRGEMSEQTYRELRKKFTAR